MADVNDLRKLRNLPAVKSGRNTLFGIDSGPLSDNAKITRGPNTFADAHVVEEAASSGTRRPAEVIDAEWTSTETALVQTPKAKAQQQMGSILRSPAEVFQETTKTHPGRGGQALVTTQRKINSKVETLYKQGQLQLPANTVIEDGAVKETYKSRNQLVTRELPPEEQKRRILSAKIIGGAGVAAAVGLGVKEGMDATSEAKGEEDPLKAMESLQPPADSKTPDDQLVEEIRAEAANRQRQGIGAGVAGEGTFRAGFKIKRIPLLGEAQASLANAERLAQGLSPEQRQFYDDRLQAARDQATEMERVLMDLRQSTLDDQAKKDTFLAVAEGLEMLGHNLTRLFAANYGLRKGVDMSGIRFDKYDWATAQARYDKRFERALNDIDSRLELNRKSLTSEVESISKAQDKAEDRLLSAAEKEADRGTRLLSAAAQQETDIARTEQQDVQHQERMALEYARLDAMKERAQLARDLREAGKADKAAALEAKNYDAAVRAFNNTIDEVVDVDSEFITDKEYKEIVKRLGQKTMEADLQLEEVIPALRTESWIPFTQGKVSKQALREALRARGPAAQVSTPDGNSGMLNLDFADSADALPSVD